MGRGFKKKLSCFPFPFSIEVQTIAPLMQFPTILNFLLLGNMEGLQKSRQILRMPRCILLIHFFLSPRPKERYRILFSFHSQKFCWQKILVIGPRLPNSQVGIWRTGMSDIKIYLLHLIGFLGAFTPAIHLPLLAPWPYPQVSTWFASTFPPPAHPPLCLSAAFFSLSPFFREVHS